ncbi:MAG: hypothetical protein IH891_11000 [Planctomycetes bacterium]|nr:hypothetical protein [Planctomycetota bacterium]
MSRLRLEYANCLADRVGTHGISASTLEAASRQMSDLTQQLNSSKGTGMECWRLLPFDPLRNEHLSAINTLVKKHRDSTDNLVVLGIGGSALGNIALHNAH